MSNMLIVVLISKRVLQPKLHSCPPQFPAVANPLVILQNPVVSIRGQDRAIPRTLADVLDRALSEKPKDRYQDARELREALRPAL
jgi:hypothetical protein